MAKKTTPALPADPRSITAEHIAFGKRLRGARLAADITQDDLGVALGVSFQQVQKYEKGVNRMDPMRMMQAAKILKVSMDQLLGIDMSRNGHISEFTDVLATPEGVGLMKAMIKLTTPQRQLVLHLARKLPEVSEEL